jgi:hypothetical protein
VTVHALGLVLAFVVGVLFVPALFLSLHVIWWRRDWPFWTLWVGFDLFMGVLNTYNALVMLLSRDAGTGGRAFGILCAALAGWMFWSAYDTWRRNRRKRKKREAKSASRIAVIAGRLRVVPATVPAQR